MSTPRTLALPDGVLPRVLDTARGAFAIQDAQVPSGTARRGHVLLVPGFTGSKEDFTPVLPLLAEGGWHATAYDQRGQHETCGKPDDDYSLAGFAADALAVQEAMAPHGRSHLVGHSFGGLVATRAVVEDDSAWRTVTLLCSGPAGFAHQSVRAAAGPVGMEEAVRRLDAFLAAVPSLGLDAVFERQNADVVLDPPIRAFLRARFLASAPESLCAIAEHLRDAPDMIDALALADVPVAVVRGADDDAWPHAAQDAMAQRLRTQATVILATAHSPAVEDPEATARVLVETWSALEA